ncbi:disulfide bond formation protein B [Qipengyuania qiaonensis]|uniref:Disulfide bond formation protein B n=1 Tax=Qipengyuania qiaonensis TaxID=2867240 RepID=A0ABS7J9F3_9SPHN|nr:disulfide bond formation protein B [Qipengyuania qiaonensis]MBX7482293.1 disulfide bond formation protein B [Qipengyuania qiaonensis]
MSLSQHARLARVLALATPALLLGGAYVSQYGFGLYPCEMCWWQRWPHFAAIGLALLAYTIAPRQLWTGFAAIAILISGGIGLFHAGVEYGWWQGVTSCAVVTGGGSGNALDDIMNTPLVRCDEPAWTLFGISLAGYNFLISTAAGLAILVLLGKDRSV